MPSIYIALPRKTVSLKVTVECFVDIYSKTLTPRYSLRDSMMPFVSFNSTTAIHFSLKNAAYDISPSLKDKTGFYVIILCSLLTVTFADTDCEILNSGIPSISATDCCTTTGITCVDGRVTEMYDCNQS
jgi:hypothetical protein